MASKTEETENEVKRSISRSRSRSKRSDNGNRKKSRRSNSRSISRSRSRSKSKTRDRSREPRRGNREGFSILVRNLSQRVDSDELKEEFKRFGEIKDVYLPLDHYSKRPRGYAFVEFFEKRDSEDAIKGMNEKTLDGKELSIVVARQRRKTPDQMRNIYGGGRSREPRERRRYRSRSRSRSPRRSYKRSRRSYSPDRRRRRRYSRSRSYSR